jgi:hypothetical protein
MKESTDVEIWTINAILSIIESQLEDLDNEFFAING